MKKIKILGVIPARYHSSRFPGKVLAKILDKPMIQHVWENSIKSKYLEKLIVATDDERVYKTCLDFNSKVMMTSKKHNSGTDRVYEVAKKYKPEIVVNIQADEPMISHKIIDETIKAIKKEKVAPVVTPIVKTNKGAKNPNITKVVIDKSGYALLFSRSHIPYNSKIFYKHIGLYAYKYDFLKKFVNMKTSYLENEEKLEQLRILENGYKIKTVIVKNETISVDTPKDLKKVIQKLTQE